MSARLSDAVISSLQVSKIHVDSKDIINSVSWSDDGSFLITSSDDEMLHVYSTETGMLNVQGEIPSKKYGCSKVTYTHSSKAVIFASSQSHGLDNTIRYLDVQNNSFIRYFRGHRDQVLNLVMQPGSDGFASSSKDQCVRLWDLRTDRCLGMISVKGNPKIAYDPTGVVMGVAQGINLVKLYDTRKMDAGPFDNFVVDCPPTDIYCVKFSPDGKTIAVNTKNGLIVMDSFNGKKKFEFTDYKGSLVPMEASYTPDAKYIMVGSDTGTLQCYSLKNGHQINIHANKFKHTGPIYCCKFNPTRCLLATASKSLALWTVDL